MNLQCEKQLRTGRCTMPLYHRGRHTTQSFECDSCGKQRRGNWRDYVHNYYDRGGDVIESLVLCFMCRHVR